MFYSWITIFYIRFITLADEFCCLFVINGKRRLISAHTHSYSGIEQKINRMKTGLLKCEQTERSWTAIQTNLMKRRWKLYFPCFIVLFFPICLNFEQEHRSKFMHTYMTTLSSRIPSKNVSREIKTGSMHICIKTCETYEFIRSLHIQSILVTYAKKNCFIGKRKKKKNEMALVHGCLLFFVIKPACFPQLFICVHKVTTSAAARQRT